MDNWLTESVQKDTLGVLSFGCGIFPAIHMFRLKSILQEVWIGYHQMLEYRVGKKLIILVYI